MFLGVGDVCSFAQMDVKKHGNPMFLSDEITEANDMAQAEDGKTEKSLINFKGKYPTWMPSPVDELFLMTVSQQQGG
jgi:autophagy-related protein 9